MDIDEYLRQKKSLEEQKKILEGKEKLLAEKQKAEKKAVVSHPSKESAQLGSQPAASGEGRFSSKTLLIINMIILLGVLGVFATFYLFPPSLDADASTPLTGATVVGGGEEEEETTAVTTTTSSESENATSTGPETVYLGPQFDLSLIDIPEGAFDADGKLQTIGQILVVNGPTSYNDFELTIQNLEQEKIVCEVDREMDIDTNLDGTFDIEDLHDIKTHAVKIKPTAQDRVIREGTVSIPGNVQGYQGKGEVWVKYETRCYFCLDELCETHETRGEEKRTAFFRVRINENLLINYTSNQS